MFSNGPWFTVAWRIHWLINYIDNKVKCRHLKKFTCKGTLRQYLSVWGPEPHTPPPPAYTLYVCICTIYLFTQGRGGGESYTGEKVRGTMVHKAGSKIPSWLKVSLIYVLWKKPAPKSPYKSIFLEDDILLWCLYSTSELEDFHWVIIKFFKKIHLRCKGVGSGGV